MALIRVIGGSGFRGVRSAIAAIAVAGVSVAAALAAHVARNRDVVVSNDAAVVAADPQAMPTVEARQTVSVRITDGSLEVNPSTVRAGPTNFVVTNAASVPYDVDVDGPEADGEIDDLAPGQTAKLSMTLRPGTYEIEADPEGPGPGRRVFLTVRG